ncbi:hypothetical protein RN001_009153 [Aquatica leii]|uniref:15-hydroxyprostaglandin dehydrogenase [NAD(+)]-like n=1 Tax=Aquatica leii TaxID=1421715 RepID=A0AAN7SDN7_9COLE|nr:hypothetical protein RN001_009153 [Aquatica leii]
MFDILGKVALVTGAASGIGLATVELLLENGLKGVTIVDINETKGKLVAENLNKKYGNDKTLFVKVNVANRNEFEDAFKSTITKFKNLDIVINCAGFVKDLRWEEEIAVNLGGTITGTYFAFENYLPKHKSESEGVIINVSSTAAFDIYAQAPVYTATKSGIVTFSRSYGSPLHYNRNQIRVMAICPGFTDTPMHNATHEKLLAPAFYEISEEGFDELVIQSVEHVAKTVVLMIKEGKTGSVWIVENCKEPYEMKFPPRDQN